MIKYKGKWKNQNIGGEKKNMSQNISLDSLLADIIIAFLTPLLCENITNRTHMKSSISWIILASVAAPVKRFAMSAYILQTIGYWLWLLGGVTFFLTTHDAVRMCNMTIQRKSTGLSSSASANCNSDMTQSHAYLT